MQIGLDKGAHAKNIDFGEQVKPILTFNRLIWF